MLDQSVLVLNRSWLAVHVCDVKRAVTLLALDLARVVTEEFETHDFQSWRELSQYAKANYLNTPRFKLLVPEIIVLTRYNSVPPRRVKFSRRNIFERDRYTCQYCHRAPARSELSVDHVVPKSRGGTTTWSNVVLACTECNARKRDRLPREAGMRLQKPPSEPAWRPGNGFRIGARRRSWQRFVDAAYWDLNLDEDAT
ncbi:MAG: HNH endonuclease [Candidatus Latescibacterota bacterium]|nr:MAG: HNH endonuclease [Candidatus Latescibacterota bacterium]